MLHLQMFHCMVGLGGSMAKRYYKPILVAPSGDLREKIEKEAKEQNRKLGPAICDVLRRYFEIKERTA